jgi:GTP cyclohydrolase I
MSSSRALRVVHAPAEIDLPAARETPGRMARAYAELFSPRPFDQTTFRNDEGCDELVLASATPVRSVCAHHLLPFAYAPTTAQPPLAVIQE